MFGINVNKAFYLLLLVVVIIEEIHSECRQSHITICDSVEDIKDGRGMFSWTEIVVRNENVNKSALTTYNLHDIIPFRKLISLTIIGQLNRISPLFGSCTFEYDLQLLAFYKNDLKTLETNSVPKLKLKKISFVDNNIEHLEGLFIEPKAQIEIADLSNNKIEAIENFVFVDNVGKPLVTKTLIMRNNKISYIQDNSLPVTLQTLNLDGNKLRNIPDQALKNLVSLQELSLNHNHLYAIPNIVRAKKLKYLDLSYNSISAIDGKIFRNLTQLAFIDLSNNKIESAFFADFAFLTNKPGGLLLSLGFNELTGFNLTSDNGSYENKLELFLYGNPFDCKEFEKIQQSIQILKIRQNSCDITFQSEGKAPYCLNYKDIFYLDVNKAVKEFLTAIENNKKIISCEIVPSNFLATPFQCIA